MGQFEVKLGSKIGFGNLHISVSPAYWHPVFTAEAPAAD
jgi:hypothetical protein